MPRFTVKRYEQILTQMIAKVVSRSELSDVSNTSVWKHVLAAAARQDDEQYYQMLLLKKLFDLEQAKGDDLDERVREIQPSIISRELQKKASGNVIIYRSGTVGTVSFSAGVQVKTADGLVFTTTAGGSITPTSPVQIPGHSVGQDSGLIPVVANVGGADGNVDPGAINGFLTKPPGVDGVTNLVKLAYGLDEESDDSLRNRAILYISTLARSTVSAIEFSVSGAVDADTGARILFSKCVEDYINRGNCTVYIDDGTGSASTTTTVSGENVTEGLGGPGGDSAVGGETHLPLDHKPIVPGTLVLTSSVLGALVAGTDYYVAEAWGEIYFVVPLVTGEIITADYTRYTGLVELAQKIIDGDRNDRVNYPGYRAAGTYHVVTTPQVLVQVVDATVVISEGYDSSEVITQVENAILAYINTLGISGDVIRSEIIKRIKNVSGVYDVNLVTPVTNVVILDDQLARTTIANVTIN